jgi:lipopolysaccharide transport system ATP-binding protein
MASIVNLCQRAILLDAGTTVWDGLPAEVVQKYLATNRSSGGEMVWTQPAAAPGNELVRLHSVRILQEGLEGAAADVDIAREVLIEIAYWNFKEGARLYAALWLKDHVGTFVLSSGNAHSSTLTRDPWFGAPHPVGLFRSVCRIPANFLNEGLYNVTAIVGKVPSVTQILLEQVVGFTVHDSGEMRKEYLGVWAGVVRPKLAWHTQQATALNRCA